jgi:glyoxylase-like metal-dependent hydrolase (beta-lactamase superfamily II)
MTNPADDRDERLRRPAGIHSLSLGDTRVSFVPDGVVQLPPRGWLPDTTDGFWADHPEYLDASGHLVASLGGLLVEKGDRALLIDAGFGPQSLPPDPGTPRGVIRGGALLRSLAELGREPDEIAAVAFTHLHLDHIGWAWHPAPGSDRPAFTGAAYLVAGREWAYRDLLAAQGTTEEVAIALTPRVRTVQTGDEIFPGVRVRITGGHTAGHAQFVITAGGRRLIAFGDTLHSPVQVDHPGWSAGNDHDRVRSADSRRRLVAELQRPDTIGFGIHLADAVFGQVVLNRAGPSWRPLDA